MDLILGIFLDLGIVFFYMSFIISINFLNLARNWPQLIQYWTRIDLLFLMPPYKPPKWSLRKQLYTLLIGFWITALVEHCLFYASGYYNFRMRRIHCHPDEEKYSFKDYIQLDIFTDIFIYFPYNIFVAVYAFFLSGTFTFLWNFLDFFIMCISLGLATRFQQFNTRIEVLAGCYVPDAVWYKIRREHIILCEFMEKVNDQISTIVLLSSLNNMYFICNNLLNIFTKLRYQINYVYFWFSLIFLLSRTICVFMFASKIHEASVLPLQTLYLVPTGCWTEEVQRFRAQILNEFIGLTGKRFYGMTRKNLFGMMATIITYELMLLQLDNKNKENSLPELCT
ncbi:gustatory receptor for sugar taste 61a-like [Lucilia cuprina]|uniref:gustatory receptor for sugar taste 61a-like n=2 Tax=Lucilia cuprina TaxID=7375 RepID=UPI001F05FCA1|nr:gustatory receptor for sugar taste 61a-like [Lucilia cuprina]